MIIPKNRLDTYTYMFRYLLCRKEERREFGGFLYGDERDEGI